MRPCADIAVGSPVTVRGTAGLALEMSAVRDVARALLPVFRRKKASETRVCSCRLGRRRWCHARRCPRCFGRRISLNESDGRGNGVESDSDGERCQEAQRQEYTLVVRAAVLDVGRDAGLSVVNGVPRVGEDGEWEVVGDGGGDKDGGGRRQQEYTLVTGGGGWSFEATLGSASLVEFPALARTESKRSSAMAVTTRAVEKDGNKSKLLLPDEIDRKAHV